MNGRRRALGALLFATALSLLGAAGAQATSLQAVGNFDEPMYLTSAPAEPNRLFVVERAGRIREVRNGQATLFADVSSVVSCCDQDRGLQSIAIAPDFAQTGRLYLDYTDAAGNLVIAELRASGGSAPLGSLRAVLTIPYEADAYHYGGQIDFGPEGNLYVSTGDGGHGGLGDEHHNAQNPSSLLGKILRIDPRQSGVLPYSVPAGNPFAAAAAPYDTIWSLGLRNPYRFSFDAASGSIAITDVGEEVSEEVDLMPVGASAGANFGWNCVEGTLPGPATDPQCATPPAAGFVVPSFSYGHKNTGGAYGCAVIGGYVVRDRSLGDLYGRYVYADFCTAAVRSFLPANPAGTDRSEGLTVGEATSFGVDSCGRLYVVARSGAVSRLLGTSASSCLLAAQVRIKAAKRKVRRGARALITVRVTPCGDHAGERVVLYRGKKRFGSRRLNATCSARFRPLIRSRGNFRVKVGADATYEAASSRRLTITVVKPRPQRR